MRKRWLGALAAALLMAVGAAALGSPDEGRLSAEQHEQLEARIRELKTKAAQAAEDGREEEARAARHEIEKLMVKLKRGAKKPALPKPRADKPRPPKNLERAAEELLVKARALRERGSVEDAEHLEVKAQRLREAHALRAESNEFERRGKDARDAGREDEARRLFEESGRAWRRSEELLGGAKKKPARRSKAPRPPSGDDHARQRLEHLRTAERHAREAGSHDLADMLARQAEEAEHALRSGEGREAELRELREEVEALRRRVRELEEELERRKRKER